MSTPSISHYLGPVSLTTSALAKRTPLRYSDNAKIRALLAKPSWSVRQRLLPKHIRDRRPRPSPLEDRLQQITDPAARWSHQSRRKRRQLRPRPTDVDDEIEREKEAYDEKGEEEEEEEGEITVSGEILRHLLRLSALPPPRAEDSAGERAMLRDLRSQIHFVRQMQRVDVDGVEPLVAIRDESAAAVDEARVGLADEEIRAVLEAEEVEGRGGEFERTRRKRTNDDNDNDNDEKQRMEWDPFELGVGSSSSSSGRRAGRWFVVKKREKSKKSKGKEEEQQQQQQEG